MFNLPFTTKSTTLLTDRERVNLLNKVRKVFLLEEDVAVSFFPSNETVFCVKVTTSFEDVVSVYFSDDVPLFFEHSCSMYPTVFAIGKFPLMIPYVRIKDESRAGILKGGHLMSSDIDKSNNDNLFGSHFLPGRSIYLNTLEDFSAIAVGMTVVEPGQMVNDETGKVVHVTHRLGDNLCTLVPLAKVAGPGESVSTAEFEGDIASVSTGSEKSLTCEDGHMDKSSDDGTLNSHQLKIQEFNVVNKHVEAIFAVVGLKKGSLVTDKDFYELMDRYFTLERLQRHSGQEYIDLNVQLCRLMGKTETRSSRSTVLDFISKEMGMGYEVKRIHSGETQFIVGTGMLMPVDITLKHLENTKKLTLIFNLEQYAIDIVSFGEELKQILDTNYSTEKLLNKRFYKNGIPNNGSLKLVLEGNHVSFVKRYLTEKHLIPEIYIKIY